MASIDKTIDTTSESCSNYRMSSDDELNDSDPFTPVTHRKRPKHGSHDSRSSETIVSNVTSRRTTLTVIVKPTDSSKLITKQNPLGLSKYLERIAPDAVLELRPNYRLNLLALEARNTRAFKALLALKIICGISVQAYERHASDKSVGVIRGGTSNITDLELREAIRDGVPTPHVRRLSTSEIVKIVFDSETATENVAVRYTRFQVLPYVENLDSVPDVTFSAISKAHPY